MDEESSKTLVEGNNLGPFSPERIELSEQLFEYFTDVLNSIHQVQYSQKFWMLIVEDHVNAVIRTKHLLGHELTGLRPGLFPMETAFRLPSPKENIRYGVAQWVRHFRSKKNLKKIRTKLAEHENLYLGFPINPCLNNDTSSTELPGYYPYFYGWGDRSKRKRTKEIAKQTEDTFLKNALLLLPRINVEHFETFLKSVPLINPYSKTIHAHVLSTPYEKMLTAWYRENGSRLVWCQHGALYGEVKVKYRYYFEQSVADEFRTWGWKLNGKDVPGKAYRLEKFKRKLNSYTAEPEFDLMVCYPNIHKGNHKEYKAKTKQLLVKCSPDKYQKILIRPRPVNSRSDMSGLFSFIEDERVTVSSGLTSIAQEISNSRMIVQMEIPSTNFLECIYNDLPVIGILENDQPTDLIIPYYKFFIEQGVMHYTWESLAEHLNSIDIDSWWDEVISAPLYKSFKKTFAQQV